jgi:two-component system phosphate regulon response regulator PhoB
VPGERILVVDDEADILELVSFHLRQAGFSVETAQDGATALACLRRAPPSLLLLDVLLPDLTGTEILRVLRQDEATRGVPVILLTARGEEVDRVVGFELGADDYVTKPFSPRELVLRVRAVLRRGQGGEAEGEVVEHAGIRLDLARHRCTIDDSEVDLTAKEFSLLHSLMARPGRVFTREQLLERVWGADVHVTERTIDTHMKRLREKLGAVADCIETVRGVGYRLEA